MRYPICFLSALALSSIVTIAAAADWQPVTKALIAREMPGYGKLSGVTVDPRSGDVYVDLSDKGIFRSSDRGLTWDRFAQPLKGRTEWPGCMQLDPTGKSKTLVVALVYGAPIAISADAGVRWKLMSPKSSHVDWCAVDWADPHMNFALALRHESGGMLIASRDGGKNFTEVGKGYGPAWIFDGKTAVVAESRSPLKQRPRLLRTTDGARTFQPCGDYQAQALPRWRDGKLFWLVDGALIATTDMGQTWKKLGAVKDGRYGPVFGRDAKQLFVLTKGGIIESTNGGASWSKALSLPKEVAGVGPLTWIAYDPIHDILYAMKMGSDLYRLERKQ